MTTEHTTAPAVDLPVSLGRDQAAPEGTENELWIADIDTTTEPRRVSLDHTRTEKRPRHATKTTTAELGWFDVRPIVRRLAEITPDLGVMRAEDVPDGAEVADLMVVRRKLADAEATIKSQNERIDRLTRACQRKNGDIERYANERAAAVEAQRAAEEETADMRARWAGFSTALARLENTTTPQVVGKHIVMRHETYTELETQRDDLADSWVTATDHENAIVRMKAEVQQLRQDKAGAYDKNASLVQHLEQERRDHAETRSELRSMTTHARKWQRFAAVIEFMEDANDAVLTIDGVQLRKVNP